MNPGSIGMNPEPANPRILDEHVPQRRKGIGALFALSVLDWISRGTHCQVSPAKHITGKAVAIAVDFPFSRQLYVIN